MRKSNKWSPIWIRPLDVITFQVRTPHIDFQMEIDWYMLQNSAQFYTGITVMVIDFILLCMVRYLFERPVEGVN